MTTKEFCAQVAPVRVGVAAGLRMYAAVMNAVRSELEASVAALGPHGRLMCPEAFRNLDTVRSITDVMATRQAEIEADIGLTDDERAVVEVATVEYNKQAREAIEKIAEEER